MIPSIRFLLLETTVLIVVILTCLTTGKQHSKHFYKSAIEFLVTTYKEKLRNCSLVFVHDNDKNFLPEITSTVAHLSSLKPLVGSHIINIWQSVSFRTFDDIHQRSFGGHCSVVVLMIHTLPNGIFQHLFNLLTPRWGPITKKDEDYYFFLCTGEITDELLLSSGFGNKIKNKIALLQDQSLGTKIILRTVHPYKNAGNPQLFNLDFPRIQNLFPDMTLNHFGRAIKMSIPKAEWRIVVTWNETDGRYHPYRGYYKTWLDEAMRKFNFTYDMFVSSLGGGTGVQLKNGTWQGAVGDVLYEQAEMAFVIGKIQSRNKFVEWSAPLSYEWMVFSCHKPRSYFSPKAIFWPFDNNMWLIFLISVIIVMIIIKLLISAQRKPFINKLWPIGRISTYVYAVLLEQDAATPTDLQFNPIRIFCAFWLLFALIVTNTYRAKLVAVIAFPIISWVPSTFEQLAYSDFHMGLNVVGKGGAAYDLFRSSTSPVFQSMFKKMGIYPNALDCLSQALNQDFCCCMWYGQAEYMSQRNLSDKTGRIPLQISTSTTFFLHDGFIYQKRAIFRHHFDWTIWNAIQMGLVDRWINMDMNFVRHARTAWEKSLNRTQVVFSDETGPQKLQVIHCIGAFAILLSGILLGTIAFLCEFFKAKCCSCTRIWANRKSTTEKFELSCQQLKRLPN